MKPNVPDCVTQLESSSSFSISFDGDNQMEASLLGASLSNLAFVVNQVVKDDPAGISCHLSVTSFRKGSFKVILSFSLFAALQLAGSLSIQDASMMFGILKGMFDIKKALKGEKPKAVTEDAEGHIYVLAKDGSEVLAPLESKVVIRNPAVDKSLTGIAYAARLHNPSGGFRLIADDRQVHYNQADVQDIALPTFGADLQPREQTQELRIKLPIRKPDLLGTASWSFLYCGRSITAKITDVEFIKRVHSGKTSYKAGDCLDVSLEITTKVSAEGIATGETYTIVKVHGHVSSPEQLSF